MTYRVRLEQFEGPLDLLLHLIQESEVDIKDIFVSEITSQYLAYMSELDELDLDTASEFLTMAATLLYIKSRQLLPRPPKEDEEEEDPETVLIRQLREYQTFKEASVQLQELYQTAKDSYTRLPEDVPLPPKNVELDGADLDALMTAFMALLERKTPPEDAPRIGNHVRPDAYTVRRQIVKIRSILGQKQKIAFEELFDEQVDKLEIIVTFMALLEMIVRGEIRLKQSAPYAPITIRAGQLVDDDGEYYYMDEEEA